MIKFPNIINSYSFTNQIDNKEDVTYCNESNVNTMVVRYQ